MEYTPNNRGKPQYLGRMKQIISFEGMNIMGNITPTDIDGYYEVHGKLFVFFEMKREGCELPQGQRLALTRNVDCLRIAGREAALFICTHNVVDERKPIIAKDTTVQKIYYRGKTYDYSGKNLKLKYCVDDFMETAHRRGIL